MTNVNKRKAIYRATLVGVLLLVPVFYLKGRAAEGDPFARDLGAVPEFLTTDAAGQAMSRFDLSGNLTFVAWLGGVCRDPAQAACVRARAQLDALAVWIDARLLYNDQDEQTPVRLVAVTQQNITVPKSWRKVEVAADGVGDARLLLPLSCSDSDAPLIVIDQSVHARRCFSLAGAASWSELQPLLSRMTINHYMHDYLAKRTFFRRSPKDPAQDGAETTH